MCRLTELCFYAHFELWHLCAKSMVDLSFFLPVTELQMVQTGSRTDTDNLSVFLQRTQICLLLFMFYPAVV